VLETAARRAGLQQNRERKVREEVIQRVCPRSSQCRKAGCIKPEIEFYFWKNSRGRKAEASEEEMRTGSQSGSDE
jgi:hypothetical protein